MGARPQAQDGSQLPVRAGMGDGGGPAAPHLIAPLLRPWRRHPRPRVCPLSCSAYDNIRLLSLAGFGNKSAVLARIIKGPLKMDAVLFPKKKKGRQMNLFSVSFFLASSQSPHQKPALFLVKKHSKYKTTQGQFMEPHTSYPFFSFLKQILIPSGYATG